MATVEASPRVAKAAAEHHLGPFIAGSKGSNPIANAIFALVVSGILFGAVVLVGSLGLDLLRKVLLVGLGLSFVGVLFALVALFTGFRQFFLYTNGIVRWQNGRVTVLHWRDVTGITTSRLGNSRIGYDIRVGDEKKLHVEAIENAEAGKLFGEQIEQVAGQAGIRVWA